MQIEITPAEAAIIYKAVNAEMVRMLKTAKWSTEMLTKEGEIRQQLEKESLTWATELNKKLYDNFEVVRNIKF